MYNLHSLQIHPEDHIRASISSPLNGNDHWVNLNRGPMPLLQILITNTTKEKVQAIVDAFNEALSGLPNLTEEDLADDELPF